MQHLTFLTVPVNKLPEIERAHQDIVILFSLYLPESQSQPWKRKSLFMVATQLNILKKSVTFCAGPNFLQYIKMAKYFHILSSLSSGKMERYRNKQLGFHSHTIPASTLFSQITTQLWTAYQHSRHSIHNMADIGSRSKYSLILQIVW